MNARYALPRKRDSRRYVKDESKMKTTLAMFVFVLLAGCSSLSDPPKDLVPRIGADVLARDAFSMHTNFVATYNAKGIPADYNARIPPEEWVGAIKDLTPVYIYYTGVGINMAIVLKLDQDTEEGIYIVPNYSSGLAADQNGVSGFSLSSEPFQGGFPHGSTYTFTRDLKHNKGVERTR